LVTDSVLGVSRSVVVVVVDSLDGVRGIVDAVHGVAGIVVVAISWAYREPRVTVRVGSRSCVSMRPGR
jgi:hypothetical protein